MSSKTTTARERELPRGGTRQVRVEDLVEELRVKGFRPKSILDVGCGVGKSRRTFTRAFPDAQWLGVDIESSPEVDQRSETQGEFLTFDGVHIPLPRRSVDLVFSRQVLEHVRHPEALLRDMRRVLSDDGYLVGSTSQFEPYHSRSYWNFTIHGFKIIARDAGFEVVDVRPGIDGFTLMARTYLGRPKELSRYFQEESPVNILIDEWGALGGRSRSSVLDRKLLFAGHFCFVLRREKASTRWKRRAKALRARLVGQG